MNSPLIPIPSDANIIRRIGLLRYLEMRSVRREPTDSCIYGPDYEPDYEPTEEIPA